jgi:hypothetical protein
MRPPGGPEVECAQAQREGSPATAAFHEPPAPGAEWAVANQRVLAAELARISARIAGTEANADALDAARAAMPARAAIDVLADKCGLTDFERDVLLMCAGVEMDSAFAAACAQPGAPGLEGHATFGLALGKLAGAHWSALAPIAPLRALRLVEVRDERAVATSRLSLDERVLHYLAGVNYLDPRLRPLVSERAAAAALAASHEKVAETAVDALHRCDAWPVVQLVGDDLPAQQDVASRIAACCRLRLRIMRGTDLPVAAHETAALAALWNRDSLLLDSALLVQAGDANAHVIAHFVGRLAGLAFVATSSVLPAVEGLVLQVPRLEPPEQERLWREALGSAAQRLNGSIDAVAAQFRLSAGDIVRTARMLRESGPRSDQLDVALWQACRDAARRRLDDLAQRVETLATWDDLVLPDQQIATLRQIVAHVHRRLQVHQKWGFAHKSARGLGVSVLFSGESGTGKTMAAEIIANELRLDLYRIDLASMVSKYIGETEKNLRRVFDAAEDSGAILLFDEADALFGKRSDVKDSHDRYANIEVSYLLQRMEAYRGLAILTTNLKGALDAGFQRRIRFVVPFPFPDAQQRERIWRGVFPAATPLSGIDHGKLAQLNVAGGNIRNIAINAAFLAADAGTPVDMRHLLQAARSEAAKRERPFSDAEVRGWA